MEVWLLNGIDYLGTRFPEFPLPSLLCAGYSVKFMLGFIHSTSKRKFPLSQ